MNKKEVANKMAKTKGNGSFYRAKGGKNEGNTMQLGKRGSELDRD